MPAVISKTVLVLSEDFEDGLDAEGVAGALARGLEAGGRLECDLCPLEAPANAGSAARGSAASAALDEHRFDTRMRAARALVIACRLLDDRTLLADRRSHRSSIGSVAFEAATRARQGGVPAYAVTAHDELDPFEARIVDLQVVLRASSRPALAAAGRKLAALI
jgi:glycerate 2-kinase